jgi:hypothetical protein
LYFLVEKFWELEHIGIKDNISTPGMSKNFRRPREEWSPQELAVDAKMVVVRNDKENFYTCSIPWKNVPPKLRNNLHMVKTRQERTNSDALLKAKNTSKEAIDAIFLEQVKKGYIEEITNPAEINREDCNYIPYFPVVRQDRSTTKVRIVFDAAAKNRDKLSLNSQIEKGPNRLQDLFGILLRFRQHNIALTADISEMFLQCRLDEKDRRYHRFWWNGKIWQWTRVLFGNLASPDISQKVLCLNAELFREEFPKAAEAISDNMYMDDVLKSVETVKEAIQLATELPPLNERAGMKICKFECNDVKVMKTIPKSLHSTKVDLDKETGSIFDPTKVLGIIWNANTDCFQFKSKFKNIDEFFAQQNITDFKGWTKSLILRFAATVYDPLGLISPFTVRSRKILQRLWQEKLGWTDLIPESYQSKWCEWLNELINDAHKINIPRSFDFAKGKNYTLHVFVDASTEAYAAAVFVRVEDSRGAKGSKFVESHLMTAKSRVTPAKAESVSRLELNSAVIGLRLGHAAAIAYCMDPKQIYFWTDSMNVLYWINTPANKLKTFVSNRVGQIQAHSESKQWRHVPTDQNPADIATRDISMIDMVNSELWWKGPKFLELPETNWPPEFKPPERSESSEVNNELKKLFSGDVNTIMSADKNPKDKLSCLDPANYSVGKVYNGFRKLLSITTRLFSVMIRHFDLTWIQCQEKAKAYLVRKSQQEDPYLRTVIDKLSQKEAMLELKELSPFLDESGILRSASRLPDTEHISYNIRCPMILRKHSSLSKLIAQSMHQQFEHPVGRQMAKNQTREQGYLILGLDNLFREIKKSCLTCKAKENEPYNQQMADLPKYRFEQPLQAFAKTGLDFAGPFHIKQGRAKHRLKSYILVFTCLQTRAVHLEATHDQSTSSVLNSFSRFIDMRGMPTEFLSDNWKSFTSPEKELQTWVRDLDEDLLIRQTCANATWRFTPPYGPHHGGIYETMVKATKRAFSSLFTEADLNMDEFRTALCRVAALLNSRPITRVKDENSIQILTPNHFLIGRLGGAVATEDLDNPVERWKKIHSIINKFWKQFLCEYIPLLSKRGKWHTAKENIQVGEVVLQLDPNTPRGQWKLAVVEEIFPSNDGKVRRCRIRTTVGSYERPITKLVPLEFRTFE